MGTVIFHIINNVWLHTDSLSNQWCMLLNWSDIKNDFQTMKTSLLLCGVLKHEKCTSIAVVIC